jgi:hypothetical protein
MGHDLPYRTALPIKLRIVSAHYNSYRRVFSLVRKMAAAPGPVDA